MALCVYCGLEAFSVIEVRYARTLKHGSGLVDDDEAPREILGRSYYACDGCLALLDFRVEHHLEPRKHAAFNLMSSVYQLLAVWAAVGLGSLANTGELFLTPNFLTLGVVLSFGALTVWFLRASVHSQYYARWREARNAPIPPRNSLGGFTSLRDRLTPELSSYLPVRIEDSVVIAAKPNSPPVRCLGPNGEAWGTGPETNFEGRGVNEWYRLVWISWQLWPLRQVVPPSSDQWTPPPPPPVTEVEVAVGTVFGAGSFTALILAPGASLLLALGVGLVAWPIGFVVGREGRLVWQRRREERSRAPVI